MTLVGRVKAIVRCLAPFERTNIVSRSGKLSNAALNVLTALIREDAQAIEWHFR